MGVSSVARAIRRNILVAYAERFEFFSAALFLHVLRNLPSDFRAPIAASQDEAADGPGRTVTARFHIAARNARRRRNYHGRSLVCSRFPPASYFFALTKRRSNVEQTGAYR